MANVGSHRPSGPAVRRIPAWLLAVIDQAMIAVAKLRLSILFAREANVSGLGFLAHQWIKHEQADEMLGSRSAR